MRGQTPLGPRCTEARSNARRAISAYRSGITERRFGRGGMNLWTPNRERLAQTDLKNLRNFHIRPFDGKVVKIFMKILLSQKTKSTKKNGDNLKNWGVNWSKNIFLNAAAAVIECGSEKREGEYSKIENTSLEVEPTIRYWYLHFAADQLRELEAE